MICYTPELPVGFGVATLQELFFGPIQLPTTTGQGRPISFGMNIKEKDMQSKGDRLFKSGELCQMVETYIGSTWESATQVSRRFPVALSHISGVRYALMKLVKDGKVISKKAGRVTVYKRKP